MEKRKYTQLYRTNKANSIPEVANLNEGELSININKESPMLFFKNTNNEIEKIGAMASSTGLSESHTMTQKSITDEFKLPKTYVKVDYPTLNNVTFDITDSGETLHNSIHNIDSNVSKLVGEVLKNETVVSASFNTVKESVGLTENLSYEPKVNATYIKNAKNIAEANNILDENIKALDDKMATIKPVLSDKYVKVDYPLIDNVTFNATNPGDTLDSSVHNIDSNVSTLVGEVLKNEELLANTETTIKETIGLDKNLSIGYAFAKSINLKNCQTIIDALLIIDKIINIKKEGATI